MQLSSGQDLWFYARPSGPAQAIPQERRSPYVVGFYQRESIMVLLTPHAVEQVGTPKGRLTPRLSRWNMVAALQIVDFLSITMLLLFGAPLAAALLLGAVCSFALTTLGAYRRNLTVKPGLSSVVAIAATVAVLVPVMLLDTNKAASISGPPNLIWAGSAAAAIIGVLTAIRFLFAWLHTRFSRTGVLAHTICVVGTGADAEAYVEELQASVSDNLLLGYFRAGEGWSGTTAGLQCLGHVDQLAAYLRQQRVDEVVVATSRSDQMFLNALVADLECLPVALSLWPGTANLPGRQLLPLRSAPLAGWAWMFKDLQDRTLAALLLLASLPVLLLIALAIRTCSPGPVFYRQTREGYGGRAFSIFKFRTMHVAKSEPTNTLVLTTKNDNRIFPLGALLRRTSLDELPQLLNVLKGDMWLIGPRPHSPLATAGGRLYADAVVRYSARHRIKPGITGWAQISGWRGPTDTIEQIQQRVTHDLYYIDHWSPLLDMRILLLTAVRGFIHKNAF